MYRVAPPKKNPGYAVDPVLHNFVTKAVMTDEIRNYVLNAHENGKKNYDAFHNERIVNKTLKQGITEPSNDLDQKHAT